MITLCWIRKPRMPPAQISSNICYLLCVLEGLHFHLEPSVSAGSPSGFFRFLCGLSRANIVAFSHSFRALRGCGRWRQGCELVPLGRPSVWAAGTARGDRWWIFAVDFFRSFGAPDFNIFRRARKIHHQKSTATKNGGEKIHRHQKHHPKHTNFSLPGRGAARGFSQIRL